MTGDHPVSCAQKRLWILDRLHPDCPAYTVPLVYRISGRPDVRALEGALTELVRRHEVLRTGYRTARGAVRQTVRPAEPVAVPLVDLTGHEDPAAEAERLGGGEALRPFDLSDGPVLRPLLLTTAPDHHTLLLTLHHIACDGWSLAVLENELSTCYEALTTHRTPELPPLTEQYTDFARWQTDRVAGNALNRSRDHWSKHLDGIPASAGLPSDHPRPAVWSFAGAHVPFTVGPEVVEQVALLARACGTTPYAVLLATFAALVREEGGGPEAVVGAPVALRERESHFSLIGMFGNTVVHRLAVPDGTAFRDLVLRARDESRGALAHQALPFELLVEELNPARDPGANPLFQLMFSYQPAAPPGLRLADCRITRRFGDTRTAKVDLSLSLTREGAGCTGRMEYSTDLFEETTARRLAARYLTLLTEFTSQPLRAIGSIL
ncbi:condensation domain-containing protein [Streptomyces sp. JV184]|uniref:condensation domain-containing protein n=1 Tax=Streptomyces sp. JV184 TaxID=858637 RepID=UPI002E7967C2|nr:condensation domain-containing protein [Streptomyces sp. JV184]MEE1748308.1 condensation domain-containing protein [Streptomyces sp. JV184]